MKLINNQSLWMSTTSLYGLFPHLLNKYKPNLFDYWLMGHDNTASLGRLRNRQMKKGSARTKLTNQPVGSAAIEYN